MSENNKIDPTLKVEMVEKYLMGEVSLREAAKQAGLSGNGTKTFQRWINIYRNEGPPGLMDQEKHRHYTAETKLAAVSAYLSGEGSMLEITRRFSIRTETQLRRWLKEYNTHGAIRSRTSGGGSYMRKARVTTYEERLKIVEDCLANDRNYGAMAIKYQCSYQQVRNWVLRYEKMGSAGLEDRRGKRIGSLPPRTPEEELRDKIAELERKNRDLQMENDLLKKVRELEMRDRYL